MRIKIFNPLYRERERERERERRILRGIQPWEFRILYWKQVSVTDLVAEIFVLLKVEKIKNLKEEKILWL